MTKTWKWKGQWELRESEDAVRPIEARLVFKATVASKDGTYEKEIDVATNAAMTADETITLKLDPTSFVDREGNVAPIDGLPTWATSDETKVSLEVTPDGLSCKCVSHLVGEADVLAEVDVQPGPEMIKRNGSVHFTVSAGQVAELKIDVAPPEPKGPSTPPADEGRRPAQSSGGKKR